MKKTTLSVQDLVWIERKRVEVKSLAMLFKKRPWKTWDMPCALAIIDKLMRDKKHGK